MNTLFQILAHYSGWIVLGLIVAVVLLIAINVSLAAKLRKVQSLWRSLFESASGENVERLLHTHLRERMEMQDQIKGMQAAIEALEYKMMSAKRFAGLVRYDAFEDVGGAQSFALALYDDRGDGILITSLVGRADCRVYCKPLLRGGSERTLSQEEQRAIQEARSSGPRAIVSP